MTQRTVMWGTAALLGIVATAAIAWSASQLARQPIGLLSEPLSVVRGLAPARADGSHERHLASHVRTAVGHRGGARHRAVAAKAKAQSASVAPATSAVASTPAYSGSSSFAPAATASTPTSSGSGSTPSSAPSAATPTHSGSNAFSSSSSPGPSSGTGSSSSQPPVHHDDGRGDNGGSGTGSHRDD